MKFLESKDGDNNYSNLNFLYDKGIHEDTIKRAFNTKSPKGATKNLRNLLSLYATYGASDWNELISTLSPEYENLIDAPTNSRLMTVTKENDGTNSQILDKLNAILEQMPSREKEFAQKQIEQDVQINKDQPEKIGQITVPSTNDPNKPEFPPFPFYQPKFPASETYRITVPGFKDVWLKDESINPTGTHKDRMAWEVTLKSLKYNISEISLISSGGAAIAIKFFFNLFNVKTKLKVLVDYKLENRIKEAIRAIGCELFEIDLAQEVLDSTQIREITENKSGFDITYRETLDVYNTEYYDWLSYEILNSEPDFCFIPFGTGDLFTNVLRIVNAEFNNRYYTHDPRFRARIEKITKCHFFGATTNNPNSKLDKLFSYYLPSLEAHKQFLDQLKDHSCVGEHSSINVVEEPYVEQAVEIAEVQKIKCEPSGIAGLALLLQEREKIPVDKKILIVNTGLTQFRPKIPAKKGK